MVRTTLLALLGVALAGCASFMAAVDPGNPCHDPEYQALRAQPVDSLSEREFQLLQQRDEACLAARAGIPGETDRRVPTEVPSHLIATRTESAYGGGWHIYVHNLSDAIVVVTGIDLMECRNIQGSCGMKRMTIEVAPNQERRVLTVRPRAGGGDSHYRYRYQYQAYRVEGPDGD